MSNSSSSSLPSPEAGNWKYQELTRVLRAKIAELPAGARLPSVRSLMQRHHLSMQTVNAAFRRLQEENLVVRRPGSGIYVSDSREVRCIVFHRSTHSSWNGDAKEVSVMQAVQAAGWRFVTLRHDILGPEVLADHPASAHVVNQDVVAEDMPFLPALLRQETPIVLMGREFGSFYADYVTGDDRRIFSTLVRHFLDLGHRSFGFLVNEPLLFEVAARTSLFDEVLASFGLPPACRIECGTARGENSTLRGYEGLSRFIAGHRGRLPFTALITASSEGGKAALRALHQAGISVPGQCSLATFGNSEENLWTTPSITAAGLKMGDWGEGVVRILRQRFSGDRSPNFGMKIPAHLTIRESSGPALSSLPRAC